MEDWQEAREPQYPSFRWNEVPANPEEAAKTVFVGNIIEGTLLNRKHGIGANNSSIYYIQLQDGSVAGLWGSTVLDPKFAIVPDGSRVRVTFEGFVKSKQPGRKPWKKFSVQYVKPVATYQEATAPAAPNPGSPVQGVPTGAPAGTMPPAPSAPAPAPQQDMGY